MKAGRLLAQALRDPDSLRDPDWPALIAAARAEQLLGSLAMRLEGRALPPKVEAILADARREAGYQRTQALWEAEMARRALSPLGLPVILVVGNRLGALNHTILTVDAIRAKGLKIAGLIINQLFDELDTAAITNKGVIEQLTGVPILTEIIHGQDFLDVEEFMG